MSFQNQLSLFLEMHLQFCTQESCQLKSFKAYRNQYQYYSASTSEFEMKVTATIVHLYHFGLAKLS